MVNSKKVFLTGCAGYIGSTLAGLLLQSAYKVTCIDNLRYTGRSLLHLLQNPNFEFIKGDVYDTDLYENKIDSQTVVVHLAAIVGEPASRKFPEETKRTNLEATKKLIDLSIKKNVKHFIFASTCSNYGKVSRGEYATEEHPLNPLSLYAETKVAIEEMLMKDVKESLKWTILRFATVYGISPRMRFDLTVNDFTMNAIKERKLVIYLLHSNRPYVHVIDVARAVKLVMEKREESLWEVFNVGSTQENYRKIDIVNLIKEEIGEFQVEFVEKGNDPRDYKVSFEKIKNKLGFEITKRVKEGIKEVRKIVEEGIIRDPKSPEFYNA